MISSDNSWTCFPGNDTLDMLAAGLSVDVARSSEHFFLAECIVPSNLYNLCVHTYI